MIRFVLKKAWQISSEFLFEDVTRLVLSRCQIDTFWKGNPLISGKSRLVKYCDLAINKNQTAASTEIPMCDLRYLGCWRFPGLQVFVGSRDIYVYMCNKNHLQIYIIKITLQETNISPKNGILKMIFLFPRWDMLIPWRVNLQHVSVAWSSAIGSLPRLSPPTLPCPCPRELGPNMKGQGGQDQWVMVKYLEKNIDRWLFQISSLFGEMIQFDEHIFQRG